MNVLGMLFHLEYLTYLLSLHSVLITKSIITNATCKNSLKLDPLSNDENKAI